MSSGGGGRSCCRYCLVVAQVVAFTVALSVLDVPVARAVISQSFYQSVNQQNHRPWPAPPLALIMSNFWANIFDPQTQRHQLVYLPPSPQGFPQPATIAPTLPAPARWPALGPLYRPHTHIRTYYRLYFSSPSDPITGNPTPNQYGYWVAYGGPFNNQPPVLNMLIDCWKNWSNNDWPQLLGNPNQQPTAADQRSLRAPFDPPGDPYFEYDVTIRSYVINNPPTYPRAMRDALRIIHNATTGQNYYTDDHYCSFIPL